MTQAPAAVAAGFHHQAGVVVVRGPVASVRVLIRTAVPLDLEANRTPIIVEARAGG